MAHENYATRTSIFRALTWSRFRGSAAETTPPAALQNPQFIEAQLSVKPAAVDDVSVSSTSTPNLPSEWSAAGLLAGKGTRERCLKADSKF